MSIDLLREPPPAPSQRSVAVDDDSRFPGKACLVAVLVMTGFYYYMIFVVPAPGADESTWAARAVLAVARCAEAHPILLGMFLIGLLAPAVVFRPHARWYVPRLAVALAILWGGALMVSSHPESGAGHAVRSFLETSRPLPETIRGR